MFLSFPSLPLSFYFLFPLSSFSLLALPFYSFPFIFTPIIFMPAECFFLPLEVFSLLDLSLFFSSSSSLKLSRSCSCLVFGLEKLSKSLGSCGQSPGFFYFFSHAKRTNGYHSSKDQHCFRTNNISLYHIWTDEPDYQVQIYILFFQKFGAVRQAGRFFWRFYIFFCKPDLHTVC